MGSNFPLWDQFKRKKLILELKAPCHLKSFFSVFSHLLAYFLFGCTCAACFGFKLLYMTLSHLTLRQPNSLYISRRTPSWASCIFSTFYSPSRLPFPQPSSSSSFHDKEEGKNVGVFVIIIWEWKFFCLWTWNDISRRQCIFEQTVPLRRVPQRLFTDLRNLTLLTWYTPFPGVWCSLFLKSCTGLQPCCTPDPSLFCQTYLG